MDLLIFSTHIAISKAGLDKIGRFSAIRNKGDNICFPAQKKFSEERSILKGNNLIPLGAYSFLLDYTPF